VRSDTSVTRDGAVRVTLTRGDVEKERTVDLRDGRFSVSFGRTYWAGTWRVRAVVLGNHDFRGVSETTNFRVRD
jgi:hypothetical protein